MNIKNIMACFEICGKHSDLNKEYLCAEHDVIYFPIDNNELSKEDRKALEKLGAHYDDEVASWAAFV